MKKAILPTVVSILAVAVVYMFIAYKPGVKPVYNQSFPQITVQSAPAKDRMIETSGFDYSTNLVVGNMLHFVPTTVNYSLGLGKDIGQMYYDKVTEKLRFWDGNYADGSKVAFGRYATEVITINTSQDTVYFPPLFGDFHYSGRIEVTSDTINIAGCTFDIQETFNEDSTYNSINSSLMPYTLGQQINDLTFLRSAGLKYQRAIVDWTTVTDTATLGTVTFTRYIDLLP